MGTMIFWILVFPMLVIGALYYLGFFAAGGALLARTTKTKKGATRIALAAGGLAVMAFPFALNLAISTYAQWQADARQAYLAGLERVSLKGRMPRHYVAVGPLNAAAHTVLRAHYGLNPYPDAEDKRLTEAYRRYRRYEFCERHSRGEYIKGTRIPLCRKAAPTLHAALNLKEPTLFIARDANTSLRQSRTIAGEIYEIRLITPREDLLVDYYEERTVKGYPSIINPYASDVRLASDGRPPTMAEFLRAALERAGA